MTPLITPRHVDSSLMDGMVQCVYPPSGGALNVIDPIALKCQLEALITVINHNAQAVQATNHFVTWAVINRPELVAEFNAHMVAERMTS